MRLGFAVPVCGRALLFDKQLLHQQASDGLHEPALLLQVIGADVTRRQRDRLPGFEEAALDGSDRDAEEAGDLSLIPCSA